MKRMPEPKYYETKTFESINEFHVACNLVREKYSVHQHEYYELELILDGEAVHSINGESTRLSKGDVVFITPMDRHGFENCLFRTITVHFSPTYLSPMFKKALSTSENRIVRGVDTETRGYFENLYKVFMEKTAKHREVKIKNLVELILLDLMPDIFEENTGALHVNDRLSEAIGFVNVNFTKDITLTSIENLYGLTPSYFSRAFKKRVGKSFVSYITEKRIDYAKKLLISGERVIDACYECGFNSERNFSRRFKEMTGFSPNEYRIKQKKSDLK